VPSVGRPSGASHFASVSRSAVCWIIAPGARAANAAFTAAASTAYFNFARPAALSTTSNGGWSGIASETAGSTRGPTAGPPARALDPREGRLAGDRLGARRIGRRPDGGRHRRDRGRARSRTRLDLPLPLLLPAPERQRDDHSPSATSCTGPTATAIRHPSPSS